MLGIVVFGTIFSARLSEQLQEVFGSAGVSAEDTAAVMAELPDALRDGVIDAYASSLAPVFWYLVPFTVVAFLLALAVPHLKLSDAAGMVDRDGAIGGAEAERMEKSRRSGELGGHQDETVTKASAQTSGTAKSPDT